MLASSTLLVPRIGTGFNLWINELVFFFLPAMLLAWMQRWPWRETYSLTATSAKAILAAMAAGVGIWVVNVVLVAVIETLLAQYVGPSPIPDDILAWQGTPIHTAALTLGMIMLAPFCEEVFFRGLMQNAYSRCGPKHALVATAVLFGLYHTLNGVSNVVPATLIGLALGYCALKTGSIWPGIALHAANNSMASLAMIGSLGQGGTGLLSLVNPTTVLLSLVLAILMLRMIPASSESSQIRCSSLSDPTQKPNGSQPVGVASAANLTRMPPSAIWCSVPLWIAIAILCFASFGEIASRAKLGPLLSGESGVFSSSSQQTMSMSAGEMSGELQIAVIEVPETPSQSKDGSVINFGFSFSAGPSDFSLTLTTPDGSIAWSDKYETRGTVSTDTAYLSVPATVPGKWYLVMNGQVTDSTFSASWEVISPRSK